MASRRTPRIIWAGQSNAQGYQETYARTALYDGPHYNPLIRAYRRSSYFGSDLTEGWRSMRARQYGVTNTIGLPSSDLVCMTRLVRRYRYAPEFIEYTKDSTSLYIDWKPAVADCYTKLVNAYNAAISTHPSPPATPEPVIVWIQGENDAANALYGANYQASLDTFFSALRSDVPALATAPVIMAMESPTMSAETTGGNAAVRAAQTAYAAANPTLVHLVETSDLSHHDGIHYSQAAHLTLGARIADTIASVIG